jgi:Family of unknown function (DUF6345)
MRQVELRTHRFKLSYCFGAALAGLAAMTAIPAPSAASQFPHAPLHIGVRCQNDFQNNWAATIDTYGMCSNFINTIKRTDWVDFYFNLHGANVALIGGNGAETCNPCGGADSVDFFLVNTHGGIASATQWALAMWDFQSFAWSDVMRLGDNGTQLKVFAMYACDMMRTSDGHFWDRMSPAFKGGLKIMLGAHDLVYDGNAQKGTEFASRMQDGEAIGQAWLEAVWYADNNNHPSAAATGVNANDCWNRAGMSLATVNTSAPLRDGQVGYMCWSGWNGV